MAPERCNDQGSVLGGLVSGVCGTALTWRASSVTSCRVLCCVASVIGKHGPSFTVGYAVTAVDHHVLAGHLTVVVEYHWHEVAVLVESSTASSDVS